MHKSVVHKLIAILEMHVRRRLNLVEVEAIFSHYHKASISLIDQWFRLTAEQPR
jgi:hypothetical protein